MTGFELYLKRNAKKFDAYLATFFSNGTHSDMRRYLYGPVAEFTRNAGKRHRPLICLLACEAVGGDPEKAWPVAAAIEHFHTAALIHDDIEDSSLTRRDEPCLHVREGEGLAINAGDLALSLVCGTVVDDPGLDDATKLRVLGELVAMTTRTIEGQALDIGWARDDRFDLSVEDYLVMATHKTAFYSGGVPLAVGAIIGGGTEEQIDSLRVFGMAAGLAFQIQDDVLNLTGTKESTKKDFRSDLTEGKRTLVSIHALQHAEKRERLLEILSSRTTDPAELDEAVAIMDAAGSIEFADDYASSLVLDAKEQLGRDAADIERQEAAHVDGRLLREAEQLGWAKALGLGVSRVCYSIRTVRRMAVSAEPLRDRGRRFPVGTYVIRTHLDRRGFSSSSTRCRNVPGTAAPFRATNLPSWVTRSGLTDEPVRIGSQRCRHHCLPQALQPDRLCRAMQTAKSRASSSSTTSTMRCGIWIRPTRHIPSTASPRSSRASRRASAKPISSPPQPNRSPSSSEG